MDRIHPVSYLSDLQGFAETVDVPLGRAWLCECQIDRVCDAIRTRQFVDVGRMVILAFWDALLLAAVHCYDHVNYGAYIATVPQAPYVKSHSGTSTHLPHLLLALVPWNETTSSLLEESGSLLQEWAKAYDSTIADRPGSGTRILQALIDDPSLSINPYNKLEPGVMQVMRKTLRKAVASNVLAHPVGR